MTYPMTIAGIKRELPLCKVADDFYIGAFIMFGDAEITVACAKELLARAPKEYDYLLTAEAKSIPLIHEMARQSGASEYFVARKGMKVYLTNPIHVQVRSITTQHDQDLYLSGEDAAKMKGKKVLIVLPEKNETVYRSARNIKGVKTTLVSTLNVYDILNCDSLVVLKDAVSKIEEVYA